MIASIKLHHENLSAKSARRITLETPYVGLPTFDDSIYLLCCFTAAKDFGVVTAATSNPDDDFMFLGNLVAKGYQAGRGGQPDTCNPHQTGAAAEAWLRGWNRGVAVLAWALENPPLPPSSD